jgi:hypothetical protein
MNDTIRIVITGRTQQYMQEWLTFRICFFDISGWSPIQNSDEPLWFSQIDQNRKSDIAGTS